MTTASHPAQPPTVDDRGGSARGPRTGSIRRIIAASLVTGLVAAALLVLVVFAGGSEYEVTGATLLGLALGWGMLAVLSIRRTDQPQRWAFAPAAAMAATGLGLLILAPGDDALTAAGWVWPPALLALAVWMTLRIRRSLAPRSGRWALYPVVAVLAFAAVGGAGETIARVSARHPYPKPGQSNDVGGNRLHHDSAGSGSPTVVLRSGLGEFSASWARIAPAVARTTRVCAYDRVGQGWSDDGPRIQDGLQAAADLHTLLDRAGEKAPFVLVGHSIGGSYAMTYAARYPEQVAGMVLLDATDPYRATVTAGTGELSVPAELAVLPSLARLGVAQLVPSSSGFPEPAAGQIQAFASSPRGWRNGVEESAAMPRLFRQAQALITLGSTPLVVLTAGESLQAHDGWSTAQNRMAALSRTSSHRVAETSHAGLLVEERGAGISERAIDDVVATVRTGTALPPD
jgi:pimeloyl-ACP methyl ester carboxylesterase